MAGLFASTARAVIETPLELMKVRRQTGQSWRAGNAPLSTWAGVRQLVSGAQLCELYRGFGATLFRTWGLMGSFFIFVDYSVRKIPDVINAPFWGPFFKGGVCATVAWWLVWPMENLKSQVQASTPVAGAETSWQARARQVLRERGVRGLYRGIGPGSARSLLANGCSMMIFTYCQSLRD